MAAALTVGQVNQYIKGLFAKDFVLSRVVVKGEVSECKYHPSGHLYFTLKDESGVLKCVMFASDRPGLAFRMEVGDAVTVSGRISIYERAGSYQLYAHTIERSGAGELYARYEALKKKLSEQGMFDEIYKRPIPPYVKCVGIVTASSGAAIRDILNIAGRRNPHVRLILTPVIVQGEDAPASIVAGLKRIVTQPVDVVIVGRGGGSIEDLWAFNDERVAQAIFDCPVPVISAVGHESDTTIADYVADLRAPTPSAAAELAVFDYASFRETLTGYRRRMAKALMSAVRSGKDALNTRQMRLSYLHPKNQILEHKNGLRLRRDKLAACMSLAVNRADQRLALASQRIGSLSPQTKLRQGYAFLSTADGKPLHSVSQITEGSGVRAYVTDGWIDSKVTAIGKEKRDDRHS